MFHEYLEPPAMLIEFHSWNGHLKNYIYLFVYIHLYVCVHKRKYVCFKLCMWKSENNLHELVLSFYNVSSGDLTLIVSQQVAYKVTPLSLKWIIWHNISACAIKLTCFLYWSSLWLILKWYLSVHIYPISWAVFQNSYLFLFVTTHDFIFLISCEIFKSPALHKISTFREISLFFSLFWYRISFNSG